MTIHRQLCCLFFLSLLGATAAWGDAPRDLTSLSLEELMNMQVTSVSKTPEKSFEAPAAIYVITQEDIRRSGVTTIPEALRLAPGVEVARISSDQWSIGIRGFGSGLSRYALVLIDGRSVYSPLFAGTYWDVQDTMLEDIDRIEVIRGPGGALWGSNAVNGVINIITKNSKETQGGLVTAGGGSEEKDFGGVRYGGMKGENFSYRFYGKYFDRDASFSTTGEDFDDWKMEQGGFRTDWNLDKRDSLTVQGDTYQGELGERTVEQIDSSPFTQVIQEDGHVFGGNVLSRWTRNLGARSNLTLQYYYDHTDRHDPNLDQKVDTNDLDFQHSFPLYGEQEFTYGTAYRRISDRTDGIPTFSFDPADRTYGLLSAFAQDQIPLVRNRLTLTIGSKVEHNDYTGWENQPSGRLAWTPTSRQTIWSAVSRAVRTPSRLDRDPNITFASAPTTPLTVARYVPSDSFGSENVVAYELGYKAQPLDSLMTTVDGFYNHYDDLESLTINPLFVETNPPPTKLVFPFAFENKMKGKTYGGEFNTVWNPMRHWRLEGSYSYLRINLENKDGGTDGVTAGGKEGSSPEHQVVLRSSMDLPFSTELDPTVRYVSELPAESIPAYWTMDVHVGWHVRKNTELAVVGQNLFQPRHAESNENVNEIQRGVYGKVTWRWN